MLYLSGFLWFHSQAHSVIMKCLFLTRQIVFGQEKYLIFRMHRLILSDFPSAPPPSTPKICIHTLPVTFQIKPVCVARLWCSLYKARVKLTKKINVPDPWADWTHPVLRISKHQCHTSTQTVQQCCHCGHLGDWSPASCLQEVIHLFHFVCFVSVWQFEATETHTHTCCRKHKICNRSIRLQPWQEGRATLTTHRLLHCSAVGPGVLLWACTARASTKKYETSVSGSLSGCNV